MADYQNIIDEMESMIVRIPFFSCWIWTGRLSWNGYGNFSKKGFSLMAHRTMYELTIGKIPKGLQLDHLCRNRYCVNPSHLEPVTARENVLRGEGHCAVNYRKTHCINGHELSGYNLIKRKYGWRGCRICKNDRRRNARKKANEAKKNSAPRAGGAS